MKAAIIILGNQWVCPYVNTYRRIFDKLGCSYDVILWDRDGSDASASIKYSSGKANLDNPVVKAWHYVRYADFIKKTVSRNGYDRLVVSGPHLAILLSGILRRRYKGRYVIDYRDISVEQHLLLGGVYSKVLESSFCNVISSSGFKKHLPRKYDYLVSHNFDYNVACSVLKDSLPLWKAGPVINVLTIGYIRNYNSNVRIIQTLGGDEGYRLKFVGRGDAAPSLESYVRANGLENVEFSGFYEKKDEAARSARRGGRRGRRGAAVEEPQVDDSRKENRVVTDPSANAVFEVSMTVKAYDFRTPPETDDGSKSKKKKKGRR